MKKVLITGATGNVGLEVIRSLHRHHPQLGMVAGVRDMEEDRQKLVGYQVSCRKFDFTDPTTYQSALEGCNLLFLLRPPHISEVGKYVRPLLEAAKSCNIQHIVFLSVQGVEKSSVIPHHKMEKLIVASKIPYTFLRPAYFMQNFATTLLGELRDKKRIFLPAGQARFTLVDVRDIGAVAAEILAHPERYINQSYELTNAEKLTFQEMAAQLSDGLCSLITYQSPSLLHFFLAKSKEKTPVLLILVMIMLHYLPRFQKAPAITDWVRKITGRSPITFHQFISDYRAVLGHRGRMHFKMLTSTSSNQ